MGSSAGKPPAAPDPSTILALQNQYNRSNSVSPFGSQSWSSSGPGGHETLTTELSPQMQAAMNRAFTAAETPYQKEYIPQGLDQLTSGILGRVGQRYGLSGSGLDTNLQHQKPAQGAPQAPMGMGGGIPSQLALQGNPGAMGGGMGALGGGMGMGGMSGGIPQGTLGVMQALQGQNSPMGMPQVNMQQPGMQQPIGRMGI